MTDGKPRLTERMWNALPSFQMPTLGPKIDIPVYVVHNGPYKEDYFFIFDFAQFVERSNAGTFVRPRLQVWAGRDDIDRAVFARQFRESFSEEFEAARQALVADEAEKARGWFTWGGNRQWSLWTDDLTLVMSQFVANVILMLALSAGQMVKAAIPKPKWLKGKSDQEKLEESIAQTQGKVDVALARMKILIHAELMRHAFREEVAPGGLTPEEDAWPLPEDIRDHLGDRRTSARW